jgi:phosphatidylserine decarboxylase
MKALVRWLSAGVLALLGFVGVFLHWRLRFLLRDPPRRIPDGDDRIVAAADGFITYVKRVDRGEIPVSVKSRKRIALEEYAGFSTEASGFLIGTYMTEYSVHRNRVPITGTVIFRCHRSAAPFNRSMARMTANLLLRRMPSDEGCDYLLTNERLTIGIRHACGAVVAVTQIADLWVNRIVAHVQVGDAVNRGEQYGLIRLGSQCDVFVPDKLVREICVVPKQYVWAGETVLAITPMEERGFEYVKGDM